MSLILRSDVDQAGLDHVNHLANSHVIQIERHGPLQPIELIIEDLRFFVLILFSDLSPLLLCLFQFAFSLVDAGERSKAFFEDPSGPSYWLRPTNLST